jgi:hypothetical protein
MKRIGILGAGGLGRGMARFVPHRPHLQLVAMADSSGYCFDENGLNVDAIMAAPTMSAYPGVSTDRAVIELLQAHGEQLDALFVALPNLPVTFYADTLRQIAEETPFKGVMVDALKRTSAVETLLPLDSLLHRREILYITGAGATPGFLTTVAAVCAQSFAEVLRVDIHFGVGVANWEAYRATIREDFLHLKGFDADRVAAMTDEDIEAELEARNGLIDLVDMEHADDIILEMAGICPRDRVHVGGLVDTRNAKKPVSTTVTVTGRTIGGEEASHVFTVADGTTMVDNVCGPALGFMTQGLVQRAQGHYGLITSADLMPRFQPMHQMAATV